MCGVPRNGSLTPRNLVSQPQTPPDIHQPGESLAGVRSGEGVPEGVGGDRQEVSKGAERLEGIEVVIREELRRVGRVARLDQVALRHPGAGDALAVARVGEVELEERQDVVGDRQIGGGDVRRRVVDLMLDGEDREEAGRKTVARPWNERW